MPLDGLVPFGAGGALPTLAGIAPGVVSLVVKGMIYEGWVDVEVRRSVKEMAGEFTLHVSEKTTPGMDAPSAILEWPIEPQDPCQIFYGGQLALSGYVDAYNPRYSKSHHAVTLQGRSKTADMVDSSVDGELKRGELKKVGFEQVARRVSKNFGVGVKSEIKKPGEPIDLVRAEPGETVFEFLERYARSQGVALTDDLAGNLRLLQVEDGAPVASLIEGLNIEEASAMLRADNRHSQYEAHGQNRGSDSQFGKQSARVKSKARDRGIRRHRPIRLLNEHKTARKDARSRAAWESAVRAGESTRVEIKVMDWVHGGGRLWMPGDIVLVVSPMLKVHRTLAIEHTVFTQSRKKGTQASLALVPPEALNGNKGGKPGPGNAPQWGNVKPDEEFD